MNTSMKVLKSITSKLKSSLKFGVVGNTMIGIGLRGLGDSIQQYIEKKSEKAREKSYDPMRTCKISCTGLLIGPLNFYWYKYLDIKYQGKKAKVIMKKILLDQIFGATFFTFIFIIIACVLDGQTFKESMHEFKKKFLYIYAIDWLIWPPSQLINFYLIPKEQRVIFVNIILVFWNVFLSYVKHC